MEKIVVSQQLAGYLTAVALGMAGGAVYDLLRLVRLRRRKNRRLTHVLDVLFLLAVTPAALWYALCIGQGELRLIMLSAMALGALVYGWAVSPLCLPLWDFWLSAAVGTVRLLLLPPRLLVQLAKKAALWAKKVFPFSAGCSMIQRRTARKGARGCGTGEKSEAKERSDPAGAAGGAARLFGGRAGSGQPAFGGGTDGGSVPEPSAPTAAAGECCAGE